jgi:uridine kinase
MMMPQYDFDTHARESTGTEVEPAPIVVVEGIFALYHDRVVDHLDLSVYVETDADERVLRRIKRDTSERGRTIDGVIEQYRSTVKPMHERFVEPTKRNADIIIPGGTNPAAIDLLREKVKTETDARTLVADASD